MGYLAYRVKVPQLMDHLQNRGLLVINGIKTSPARFLVAKTGISVGKAYQAIDPSRAGELSMDVLWKIYAGLKGANLTITDKGKERPISFQGDVYEDREIED